MWPEFILCSNLPVQRCNKCNSRQLLVVIFQESNNQRAKINMMSILETRYRIHGKLCDKSCTIFGSPLIWPSRNWRLVHVVFCTNYISRNVMSDWERCCIPEWCIKWHRVCPDTINLWVVAAYFQQPLAQRTKAGDRTKLHLWWIAQIKVANVLYNCLLHDLKTHSGTQARVMF